VPPVWFGAEGTSDHRYLNRVMAITAVPSDPATEATNVALEAVLDLVEHKIDPMVEPGVNMNGAPLSAADDIFVSRPSTAVRPEHRLSQASRVEIVKQRTAVEAERRRPACSQLVMEGKAMKTGWQA